METITVDYLTVSSKSHGEYTLLKLKEVSAKEIRSNYKLVASLEEGFGKRFVIVEVSPDGMVDYILNEHTVGIPTPEFERQLSSAEWQTKEITVDR
jgi:hypothetical protein